MQQLPLQLLAEAWTGQEMQVVPWPHATEVPVKLLLMSLALPEVASWPHVDHWPSLARLEAASWQHVCKSPAGLHLQSSRLGLLVVAL